MNFEHSPVNPVLWDHWYFLLIYKLSRIHCHISAPVVFLTWKNSVSKWLQLTATDTLQLFKMQVVLFLFCPLHLIALPSHFISKSRYWNSLCLILLSSSTNLSKFSYLLRSHVASSISPKDYSTLSQIMFSRFFFLDLSRCHLFSERTFWLYCYHVFSKYVISSTSVFSSPLVWLESNVLLWSMRIG